MTAPTLTEFEAALLERLQTLLLGPSNPDGPFRRVEYYEGQLAALIKGRGFDGPAIWMHIDESDEDWHTDQGLDRRITAHVFVASHSYRSTTARRRGAGDELGVTQLLDRVKAVLFGHRLGLEIQPLRPMGFHSVVAPEQALEVAAAIYRYDWEAKWVDDRPDVEPDAAMHQTSWGRIDEGPDGDTDLESKTEHT